MGTVAGHDFDPITNRCRKCARYWSDVRPALYSDVGKKGWSCDELGLGEAEYNEIVAKRDREDVAYAAATGWR